MSRIYVIDDKETKTRRLVRGGNQAQALHRLVKDRFTVAVASQDELLALVQAGEKVLEPGATDTTEQGQGGGEPQGQAAQQ